MSSTAPILAFADDLTGALEVGAKFAQFGAAVLTDADAVYDTAAALVIDTETRHLESEHAAARMSRIIDATRGRNAQLIYKKTDSTLRGNIGAELSALARAYPECAIVFAPAYPEMGRTVRYGRVHLKGLPLEQTAFAKDALNPVLSSDCRDVVSAAGLRAILHEQATSAITPGTVHIFDAETEDDVAAVAKLACATNPRPIFCGTGSLAGHLSRALNFPSAAGTRTCTSVRSCLVVNGSRNQASQRQIECARAAGWRVARPAEMLAAGMPAKWTILECPPESCASAQEFACQTGRIVRELAIACGCETLIVFGGDTAYAVAEAMNCRVLYPAGEILPGIPVSFAGGLQVITKAGGFGAADLLLRIRQHMREA